MEGEVELGISQPLAMLLNEGFGLRGTTFPRLATMEIELNFKNGSPGFPFRLNKAALENVESKRHASQY